MAKLEIRKNSFTTLFFTVQQQPTPESSLSAFDFTSTTAIFAFAVDAIQPPIFQKSTTSVNEAVFTSVTGGEMEVYIESEDTAALETGRYKYTLQAYTGDGKEYNLAFNTIHLKDNINI